LKVHVCRSLQDLIECIMANQSEQSANGAEEECQRKCRGCAMTAAAQQHTKATPMPGRSHQYSSLYLASVRRRISRSLRVSFLSIQSVERHIGSADAMDSVTHTLPLHARAHKRSQVLDKRERTSNIRWRNREAHNVASMMVASMPVSPGKCA
jgi:hypothetical protein